MSTSDFNTDIDAPEADHNELAAARQAAQTLLRTVMNLVDEHADDVVADPDFARLRDKSADLDDPMQFLAEVPVMCLQDTGHYEICTDIEAVSSLLALMHHDDTRRALDVTSELAAEYCAMVRDVIEGCISTISETKHRYAAARFVTVAL